MTFAAYKRADVVDGRSLRTGVLRYAKDTPDRVALVVAGVSRTYAEIDDTARRWANALMNRLERRLERVGVFAYRTEVAYTATLACLYAGAAFVPLNKTFPVGRTASMAREAGLDAMIVDSTSLPQLPEVLSALDPVPLVMVPHAATLPGEVAQNNAITRKDLASIEPARCLPPVMADDLAYLLFTSGSTGKPKGVGVTHANILSLLDVMQSRLNITREDRFSQTFAPTFDVSVFDLFMAWEHGASVYGMRQIDVLAPTRYINQNNLTVWFSVPSVITLMRRKGNLRSNSMLSLRYSLFAGEPLPKRSAESWLEAAPNSIVENLYGPTELTVVCMGHRWDPLISPAKCHNGLVPLGRPFPGLCALVVSSEGGILDSNQEGELYIAGPQTVPAYWLDEEKTRRQFVRVRLSHTTTKRFYKTGDRVVRRPEGEFLYLGRVDHQVKVLGYRVELAEIEGILCQDPNVLNAVALGWPNEEGRALGIVAFVTGADVDTEQLKDAVARRLPAYVVPTEIHVLEQMPWNSNGKIDRFALLAYLSANGNELGNARNLE